MVSARRTSLSLIVWLLGCGHGDAPPPPAATADDEGMVVLTEPMLAAVGVAVAPVVRGPRRAVVSAFGRVAFDPQRVARIGPLVEGRVLSIQVQAGQTVAAGAVLATVESLDVGRARAEYAASTLRLRQSEIELARTERMREAGVASSRESMSAQAEHELAGLSLRAAAARLHAVGGRAEPGVQSGRTGAAVALTTPIAGAVLSVDASIGQPVGATDTLFVVGDRARVWVLVDVFERDLGSVRAGDPATVEFLAAPSQRMPATVDAVSGEIDPVRRAATVRLLLENRDGVLRPGMSATARIEVSREPGATALRVARTAVQPIDGQPFVFVERAHGRFELRAVERGEDLGGDVEIVRGLREGESVVVTGAFLLRSEVLRAQMGKND